MTRERNDSRQYADGIDPDTIVDVFDARDDLARPVTAGDVVNELEIARRTAHNKLNALVERGELETRKIGARGRVRWQPLPREESDDTNAEHAVVTAKPTDATKLTGEVRNGASDHTRDESEAGDPADLGSLSFERDLRSARREHLQTWLRYAADCEDGILKSDFDEWWTDDRAGDTGYNAGSFWEVFAKSAMTQSDRFVKPNTWTYQYDARRA